MPLPARVPTTLERLQTTVGGWVRQLLAPIDVPYSYQSSMGLPVAPDHSPQRSLSALGRHPWVRACVRAKCDDVGGLRLVAVRGDQTADLVDHPFLRIARRPSPGITWTRLARQIEADLVLNGTAFFWLRRVGVGPEDWEIYRLHPAHLSAKMDGPRVVAWVYGQSRQIPVSEVFPIADISYSDGLSAIYGSDPMECLAPGLQAVASARRLATSSAGRGRPDLIVTLPKDAGVGPEKATDIADTIEARMAQGHAVSVVGGGAEITTASWTPKDLEFPGLDTRVRDETLAVLRVPPTRAGIPQANYAVAKAELRDYWGALVVSDLALISDALTAMAHAVGGDLGIQIRHDLASVEALQTSYDQRQARAGFWVQVMGAAPDAAAAYEGFRDAPVGGAGTQGPQPSSRPALPVDEQPARQSVRTRRAEAISRYLAGAAARLQGIEASPDSEAPYLAGALEGAGVDWDRAVDIAEAVALQLCEAAIAAGDRDLSTTFHFSPAYAETLARRCEARGGA